MTVQLLNVSSRFGITGMSKFIKDTYKMIRNDCAVLMKTHLHKCDDNSKQVLMMKNVCNWMPMLSANLFF